MRRVRVVLRVMSLLVAIAVTGVLFGAVGDQPTEETSESRAAVRDPGVDQALAAQVAAYPPERRAILHRHLERALSRLSDQENPAEVAAAVNSYLHQYLRNEDISADGPTVLEAGHAACGGTANTMRELLHLAGINTRPALLLGIPYQGNHSLVEVYLPSGEQGLFDPTFGVFFRKPGSGRLVGTDALLRDPSLASSTLHKSAYAKRLAEDEPVVSIRSIRADYRLRRGYREVTDKPGLSNMDWQLAFRVRRAGGIADGREMRLPIPIRVGDTHGDRSWDPNEDEVPWNDLALLKDRSGRRVPWAYQIGQFQPGYNAAHVYRMRGLRPGRRYKLRMRLPQTLDATVTATSGERVLLRRQLPDLPFSSPSTKNRTLVIPFTATRERQSLKLRVRGSALIQSIALTR